MSHFIILMLMTSFTVSTDIGQNGVCQGCQVEPIDIAVLCLAVLFNNNVRNLIAPS